MNTLSKQQKQEIFDHAKGLQDQEYRYFHHEHCEASHGQRDHKKRLWVKLDGNNIAYRCHHCGVHGSLYLPAYKKQTFKKSPYSSSTTPGTERFYRLPDDRVTDIREFPAEARIWLLQYGLTSEEMQDYGICYSDTAGGIVLPVFMGNRLSGFQVRSIPRRSPKYITYRNSVGMYFRTNRHFNDTVVITEDIISAIKCSRYHEAVALLGSTASLKCLEYLITFKRVLIFMDNDNADIKKKQRELKKSLELFTAVQLIQHDKDPKECTDTELQEILNG